MHELTSKKLDCSVDREQAQILPRARVLGLQAQSEGGAAGSRGAGQARRHQGGGGGGIL